MGRRTPDNTDSWCRICERPATTEGCAGCGDPLTASGATLAAPEFGLPTAEQARQIRFHPERPLSEIFGPDETPVPPESLESRRERYRIYRRSPHWESMRAWALERAEHRCQVCNGTEGGVQVHHRTYDHLGSELPADLIVLCGDCHGTFHKTGKLAA